MRFSGLEKTAQFWVLSRRVKGKEVGPEQYTYYAVWTIDKNLFQQQLDAAMANVADTSTEEKALKDLVRQKLADQLSVASNDTSTAEAADDFVVTAE